MPSSAPRPAATLTAIAEACGVSPSTVSLALRGDVRLRPQTRERICAHAREVGYRPNRLARRLKASATRTIGCILPSALQTFSAIVLDHLYQEAFGAGYQLQIFFSQDDPAAEARAIERCLEERVEGLIINPSRHSLAEMPETHPLHEVVRRRIPCVSKGRFDASLPTVLFDAEQAMYRVTDYLLSRGYSQVRLMLATSYQDVWQDPRVQGSQRALAEHNRSLDPAWVYADRLKAHELRGRRPDGSPAAQYHFDYRQNAELGAQFAAAALAGHRGDQPLALVCSNDRVAAGALRACNRAGAKVPEQVVLTGCDDAFAAELDLTTFRWDYEEYAKRLLGVLLAQIEGRMAADDAGEQKVGGELIVRRSTG